MQQNKNILTSGIMLSSGVIWLYDFYTLQQNKNKTTAWILLGSVVALMVGAILWSDNDEQSSFGFSENFDTQGWMFIAGGVATLASIPFFISSGRNKKEGSVSLQGGTVSAGNLNFEKHKQISISLTIPI